MMHRRFLLRAIFRFSAVCYHILLQFGAELDIRTNALQSVQNDRSIEHFLRIGVLSCFPIAGLENIDPLLLYDFQILQR